MLHTLCRILLVEDDDCSRLVAARALSRALRSRGTIHFVDGGERAIDYLAGEGAYANRELYPFPTMLITDLNMPKGDGFAVLEFLQLNPAWSVIPKIVFSSSDDADDVATAYLLGASAFHQKPCSADALAASVEQIVAYWLTACIPAADEQGRLQPTMHQGKLGSRYPFPPAAAHMMRRARRQDGASSPMPSGSRHA